MKQILTLLAFCFFCNYAQAQIDLDALPNGTIYGKITCPNGAPIANAEITLTGNNIDNITATTNSQGMYKFINLPVNSSYQVNMVNKTAVPESVDIDDAELISDYIQNFTTFSPFQILSADANLTIGVTAYDLVLMSQHIEGIQTAQGFGNWVFLRHDYDTDDAIQALSEASIYTVESLDGTYQMPKIIGFIHGDVNYSGCGN